MANSQTNRRVLTVMVLAPVFAVGWAVLFPYFRDKPDRDLKQVRYKEASQITWALHVEADQHPEKMFPTNLGDAFLRPEAKPMLARFDYLRPTNSLLDLRKLKASTIILVEKPGHYKGSHGGYVGYDSGAVRFLWGSNYTELLKTNQLLKDPNSSEKQDR